MPQPATDYRQVLQHEFSKRCDNNPSYSLRAFALKLDLPVSTLSGVLNQKHGLSKGAAEKIATKLGYSKEEREHFVLMVESRHARAKTRRQVAQEKLRRFQKSRSRDLSVETWTVISEWQHLAIWSMSRMTGFKSDPLIIARRLGLSITVVRASIQRMFRLGLIKRTKDGFVRSDDFSVILPHDVPSQATKSFHSEVIKRSLQAMYTQPLEERNFSCVMTATSKAKIAEAKNMIMEFNRQLNDFLSATDDSDAVYCFSSQLFSPLESPRVPNA